MHPHQLEMIERDGHALRERSDAFARAFYATLFDLAPGTRDLFPDDLAAQRVKLVAELDELVATAVAWQHRPPEVGLVVLSGYDGWS